MDSRLVMMLSLMVLVLTPVGSVPCPQPLSLNCSCSRPASPGWNITCEGNDIVNITRQLPPTTHHFHYTAMELFVLLGDTDFSHVTQLKTLVIKDPGDEHLLVRKIYPFFASDRLFRNLTMLQRLSINVNWEIDSKLPNLFKGLPNLETLDLSNTRLMNIDNLIHSLQGLENNTKVTTLNLWNIKTLEHSSSNLEFKLSDVLAPLNMSKLEVLNIGYNAFRSVAPGILQYAPYLKKLIVRNNFLIPILTSSLMIEVILHPALEEADFSEQGYRPATVQLPTNDDTSTLRRIQTLNHLFQLTSNVETSRAQQTCSHSHTGASVPPQVLDFLKRYMSCVIMLYEDTCNMFKDECQPVRTLLTQDHELFCAILEFLFRWQFFGVHCSYIPSFAQIINPDCGACLVIPSLGNIRVLKVTNLNIYDYVLLYGPYRNRPLCFYPNTSLESIDMSGNIPHGYPELYQTFNGDIRGLPNAKMLNTSHNSLQNLFRNISANFPALEYLNASHNLITFADERRRFLDVAESVQSIDLSYNSIKNISVDLFSRLSRLRHLDLSYNLIEDFRVNLSSSVLLGNLDLSGNNFDSLPQYTIDQLNEIALSNSSQMLKVNLRSNPLLCTCATRHFVDWVRHTHPANLEFVDEKNYVCTNKNTERVTIFSVSTAWWFDCNKPAIYSSLAVLLTLILFVGIVGYKKRFYLSRLWYQRMRQPCIPDNDQRHEFDAVVCYYKEDDDWIEYEMKRYFRHMKIAYIEETVTFGQRYQDVVDELFQNSRRSILVLSPEFTEFDNFRYQAEMVKEMMGRNGRKSAVFVVLKPLNAAQRNNVNISFREHPQCFRWRENNYDAQDLFWVQLVDIVRSPLDGHINDTSVLSDDARPLLGQ